jgi:hypothetical protein
MFQKKGWLPEDPIQEPLVHVTLTEEQKKHIGRTLDDIFDEHCEPSHGLDFPKNQYALAAKKRKKDQDRHPQTLFDMLAKDRNRPNMEEEYKGLLKTAAESVGTKNKEFCQELATNEKVIDAVLEHLVANPNALRAALEKNLVFGAHTVTMVGQMVKNLEGLAGADARAVVAALANGMMSKRAKHSQSHECTQGFCIEKKNLY